MKKMGIISVLIMLLAAQNSLYPKEYFVSEDGVDDAGRSGSLGQPYRQLSWVLGSGILASGDTLTALPGEYNRLSFWDERYFFDTENPVLIRSQVLYGAQMIGINMGRGTGIIFEGFDVVVVCQVNLLLPWYT